MNQIASVIFAYSPKNDDELELTVGDKIEVIGYEQEGWWKGKLKGRTGVFPSNFVQVIEPSPNTQNQNKLNSPFGSLINAKNSISSNSLNNINSTGNFANNNNSTSNSNLIMNNAQQQEVSSPNDCNISSSTEDSSTFHKTINNSSMLSERRPKPLRGIGYGDIFAAGAKTRPLPADPSPSVGSSIKATAMASERLSTTGLASTLQKPIPKKPPPPAPVNAGGTNGSPSDQAPALPPKPSNQFNPFIQQQTRHQLPYQMNHQRTVVDRVQVIYAYKPSNSDELEMEVGDIIDVLEKNIEDQGWWRGELKGKIGVFPDNFVQSISLQPQQQPDAPVTNSALASSNSYHSMTTTMTSDSSPPRQNGYSNGNNNSSSPLEPTSPSKLNHITATRAKGPARRPPKNILNKRNQLNESSSSNESKRDVSKPKDDPTSTASLIAFEQTNNSINPNTASMPQNVMYPDILSSLPAPADHHPQQQQQQPGAASQVKSKLTNIQTPTPTVTTTQAANSTPPPWMVELRKTNAEKKRDPTSASLPSAPDVAPPTVSSGNDDAQVVDEVKAPLSAPSLEEFNELKMEVEKLKKESKIIEELKSTLEGMKVELKACQSATESQRKYIKDLVNNLADERKRIAAMQVEIDRNLK